MKPLLAVLLFCTVFSPVVHAQQHDSSPDGREYVGTGVHPDIVVHPTLGDVMQGNDRVLEKGIKVLTR